MRTQSLLAGLAVLLVGAALVKRHKDTSGSQSTAPGGPGRYGGGGPEPEPDPAPEGDMEMSG